MPTPTKPKAIEEILNGYKRYIRAGAINIVTDKDEKWAEQQLQELFNYVIGEDKEQSINTDEFCDNCDWIPTNETGECQCTAYNDMRAKQRQRLAEVFGGK